MNALGSLVSCFGSAAVEARLKPLEAWVTGVGTGTLVANHRVTCGLATEYLFIYGIPPTSNKQDTTDTKLGTSGMANDENFF